MMRLFTCALACGLVVQGAGKKPLDTTSVFEWRTPSSPQISPDGRFVVWALEWADPVNDAFHSNIWMTTTDGTDTRPVTQGNYRDTSPRLSPDGKRMAYISNRNGKAQIYVRWLDSGQEAQITHVEQGHS